MPTAKPRITLTLEPRAYEVLSRLSAVSGDSMSSIVAEFVGATLPSMERLVVVLERARSAPEEVKAGLAAAAERAERDLVPALMAATGMQDMFLVDIERATAAPVSVPPVAPVRVAAARRAGDPRPSNTGVRSSSKLRKPQGVKGGRRG